MDLTQLKKLVGICPGHNLLYLEPNKALESYIQSPI